MSEIDKKINIIRLYSAKEEWKLLYSLKNLNDITVKPVRKRMQELSSEITRLERALELHSRNVTKQFMESYIND